MRILEYTKLYNGRDIGGTPTKDGHTIKYGRLFRSGELYDASEEDKALLASLNLTDVIDFREAAALVNKPDYKIDGVIYHNFPPVKFQGPKNGIDDEMTNRIKAMGGGYAFMINLYKHIFASEMAIEAYSNFFKVLLEDDNKTILWHCAQGKDRAGMASFLLEYALGVSYEDCVKDYLTSKIAMDAFVDYIMPFIKAHYVNDDNAIEAIKSCYTVSEDYLNTAMDYLKQTYGSIDNFIVNALKVDISKLRDIYLD